MRSRFCARCLWTTEADENLALHTLGNRKRPQKTEAAISNNWLFLRQTRLILAPLLRFKPAVRPGSQVPWRPVIIMWLWWLLC